MGMLIVDNKSKAVLAECGRRPAPRFYITGRTGDFGLKDGTVSAIAYLAYAAPKKQDGLRELIDFYDFRWVAIIKMPLAYGKIFTEPGDLGEIRYSISADGGRICARTLVYEPRRYAPDHARGIGYFIEIITTNDLQKLGVTHISTTPNPSESRISQLERVGLPIQTEVPIAEWKLGLARGFKFWNDKFLAPYLEKT